MVESSLTDKNKRVILFHPEPVEIKIKEGQEIIKHETRGSVLDVASTPVLASSGFIRLTTFFFIHASRGAAEEIARRVLPRERQTGDPLIYIFASLASR